MADSGDSARARVDARPAASPARACWTGGRGGVQVAEFLVRNKIAQSRVSALGLAPNAFLVATDPGFPSLDLANALAGQDGMLISSSNWRREVVPS